MVGEAVGPVGPRGVDLGLRTGDRVSGCEVRPSRLQMYEIARRARQTQPQAGMLRSRPTPSHIRHRLSPDVEVVILYEACFDALPKFMFEAHKWNASERRDTVRCLPNEIEPGVWAGNHTTWLLVQVLQYR